VAFAIDHNNLTLLGGHLGLEDVLGIWDEEGLQQLLGDLPDPEALLASLSCEDLAALLAGPELDPVPAEEQSRLDEKACVTCPECGAELVP